MLKITKYPNPNGYQELLKRPQLNNEILEAKVNEIIQNVKTNGDQALIEFARKFDQVEVSKLIVSEDEISASENQCSPELKSALNLAAKNIEKFHSQQQTEIEKIETTPGVFCWRKSVAIQKVGIYVPGGSAPLFSSVLMLGIPAKIAGCQEIILCTPPSKLEGRQEAVIHPAILYAAKLVGINKIYKVGGAQAIAAMAYGTDSIPAVYKIFGPGNQYVTCAKQLVSKNSVAIDMPAGPSELAVYADLTANASFVAADLLSQAEHGPDSQVILVSTNLDFIEAVNNQIASQLEELPRKNIAKAALENSRAILVENPEQAIALLNEYAAEHLILACEQAQELAEAVINAGSVFIGNYACESLGDYASGTNHTLPTNGYAKAYSGVSLDSFVKKITFQEVDQNGIKNIGPAVEIIAEAEGLLGHKRAVSLRLACV
jgi:histidinol dehydrogenase